MQFGSSGHAPYISMAAKGFTHCQPASTAAEPCRCATDGLRNFSPICLDVPALNKGLVGFPGYFDRKQSSPRPHKERQKLCLRGEMHSVARS